MKARARLERKFRRAMGDAITIGPMSGVQQRIVKASEEMASHTLLLMSVCFWIGVLSVIAGQLIYRSFM